jgi:hypothetical protein
MSRVWGDGHRWTISRSDLTGNWLIRAPWHPASRPDFPQGVYRTFETARAVFAAGRDTR